MNTFFVALPVTLSSGYLISSPSHEKLFGETNIRRKYGGVLNGVWSVEARVPTTKMGGSGDRGFGSSENCLSKSKPNHKETRSRNFDCGFTNEVANYELFIDS